MPSLTFAALRAANVARCETGFGQPLNAWDADHWLTALGGEVGEVCDVVKKLARDAGGYAGNAVSRAELLSDLGDELADAVIYLDLWLTADGHRFFGPAHQVQDFAQLRGWQRDDRWHLYEPLAAELPLAVHARRLLVIMGRLAEPAHDANYVLARQFDLLLGLDELAEAAGIALGPAIVDKFNRTSERIGYAPRLELAA